jgi:hypothetical protein
VIAQLVSRIRRDQGYLAYRKAAGRKTRYDEQVTSDLQALALAAVFLVLQRQIHARLSHQEVAHGRHDE